MIKWSHPKEGVTIRKPQNKLIDSRSRFYFDNFCAENSFIVSHKTLKSKSDEEVQKKKKIKMMVQQLIFDIPVPLKNWISTM